MSKEEARKKIRSGKAALRSSLNNLHYGLSSSRKSSIHSVLDMIKKQVIELHKDNEDIKVSNFAQAYADLTSAVSTAEPFPSSSTKTSINDAATDLSRALTKIEFELEGIDMEEFDVSGEEEMESDEVLDALME